MNILILGAVGISLKFAVGLQSVGLLGTYRKKVARRKRYKRMYERTHRARVVLGHADLMYFTAKCGVGILDLPGLTSPPSQNF